MVNGPDMNREPCPDRILEDAGGAFGHGGVRKLWLGHDGRALLERVGNVAKPRPLETHRRCVNLLRTSR